MGKKFIKEDDNLLPNDLNDIHKLFDIKVK